MLLSTSPQTPTTLLFRHAERRIGTILSAWTAVQAPTTTRGLLLGDAKLVFLNRVANEQSLR